MNLKRPFLALLVLILVVIPLAISNPDEPQNRIWLTPDPASRPILLGEPTPPRYVRYDGCVFEINNNGILIDPTGQHWRPIEVDTSAYTYRVGIENKLTSTLVDARTTYGCAVNIRLIPYGSVLWIDHYGVYKADDTGRSVNEDRLIPLIDLRIPWKRYDGVWRSQAECVRICMKHGIKHTWILIKEP